MRKPPSEDPTVLKSIDDELYKLSYDIKFPMSLRLFSLLKKASIEENNCESFDAESLQDMTAQEKIYFKSRPKETYREIEYDYIAPELSSLVKPEELTDEQYRKLAGTDVSLEQMEEVSQFLEQKKEETEGLRIVPILLDEEEWM